MDFREAEIAAIIGAGEGKTLEFKRGLPRDEKTARTLCAFANTRGGLLLVGVGDRGGVIGAPKPRVTMDRLRKIAAEGIEPSLSVEVRIVRVGTLSIVCCSVPLSPHRPHAVVHADGDPEIVVRAGSSNRVADGATLKALRAATTSKKSPDPLEKRVLAWVDERSKRGTLAESDATVAGFALAFNIGKQRARRAFVELERAGWLIGHGIGVRRVYLRA
jgi:predicted HTH transcriptional regulator